MRPTAGTATPSGRAKRWVFVGGTSAFALALAFLWARRQPEPAEKAAAPAAKGSDGACIIPRGLQKTYAISMSTKMSDGAATGFGLSGGRVEMHGELKVRWHGEDAGQTILAAKLALRPRASGSAGAVELDPELFAQPIVFRVTKACEVPMAAFAPATPAAVRNHWKVLLARMEFVQPKPKEPRWQATQRDSLGTYVAHYSRSAIPSGIAITRTKSAYTVPEYRDAAITLREAFGSSRWRPSEGWLDGLESREDLRVAIGAVVVNARGRLALTGVPTDAADPFWAGPLDITKWEFSPVYKLDEGAPPGAPMAALDAASGRPDGELLAEMLLASRATRDLHAGLSRLVPELRVRPELPALMLRHIRANPKDVQGNAALFLALQLAGGPAVHKVLGEALLDTSLPLPDRMRAISALKDTPDADASVVEKLAALRDRVSSRRDSSDAELYASATLGMGSLLDGSRLDGRTRESVIGTLRDELTRADDASARVLLGAVANSAEPSFAGAVEPFTRSATPALAAEAYRTLEAIGATPKASSLVPPFASDTTGAIRAALVPPLVRAGSALTEGELGLLCDALHRPDSVNALLPLIEVLGPLAASNDVVRAHLKQLFTESRDARVLSMIGRFLPATALP